MNVNMNNISSMPQKIISAIKPRQGNNKPFINMLSSMMGDKSAGQEALQSEGFIDFNVFQLLKGSSININMSDANTYSTGIYDYMSFYNDATTNEDKVMEELAEIKNPFNFSIPSSVMPEMSDIITAAKVSTLDYVHNLTSYDNYNVLQSKQNFVNNDFLKSEISNLETGENSPLNISSEKLIAEIEESRDKLKNNIEMVEMLTSNRASSENQNTIIKLSDESSQIKSQVLSQVKDKIVFMAEEGTEPGTAVKHVTMELNPESLGKVDIKMTFENNQVTVEITALNEETKKLISSSIDELTSILGKSAESVKIVVKSSDPTLEHQINNYNQTDKMNQAYQDDENYEQRRQRNNYYFENNKDSKDDEDDNIFSQLVNLRSIKLNA